MYIPPHFCVDDPETLTAFLLTNSFASLVTVANGEPFATHLPLLYQPETNTLIGHLAKANPQCEHLASAESVLAIFTGPHGYISPRWYTHAPAVPTWNYTAVHAYGTPKLIIEPEALTRILLTLEVHYESEPVRYDDAFFAPKLKGIVGVEIAISRLEGKSKLSQNIPAESRANVIETLKRDEQTALATIMENTK
ncbi:FMN-binding negative transcriptional regulator [Armatimonas sp.]|uniref:FMN-binding negative transcriptional regulator n=1 Tax=Armatimonas sp. TaxID=1872638 RepID=UPI00286D4527|nr:FMN-binding negative transcriptional regulator [Armatimonas sp.]